MKVLSILLVLAIVGVVLASPDSAKNCVSPKESGLCKASIRSWYFNTKTGKCEEFTYGGCGGNGNRYDSFEECEENCVLKSEEGTKKIMS